MALIRKQYRKSARENRVQHIPDIPYPFSSREISQNPQLFQYQPDHLIRETRPIFHNESDKIQGEEGLPHQIDAIFTELEDQLIAVKNNFVKRGSKLIRPQNTKQKVPINEGLKKQIQTFNNLLSKFKGICNSDKEKSAEQRGERAKMNIFEALIEGSQN